MKDICFIEIIEKNIKSDTIINNWSIDNKCKIPYYKYLGTESCKCILEHPQTKKKIQVPEKSFQYLYRNWQNYKKGELPRNELRNNDQYTTYTICILHYLEENGII